MGAILSYSIASGIVLACLYLAYRWTMASERQFTLNRVTLYLIYIVSLMSVAGYDWINIPFWSPAAGTDTLLDVDLSGMASADISSAAIIEQQPQPLWLTILISIYALGVCVAAVRFLSSLIKIYGIISKGEIVADYGEYHFIVVADRKVAPFSCLRYIVVSEQDYKSGTEPILIHELTHLRSRHWIDLIVANLVAVFQWFNPAAWLMIEEFKTVHEYQADDSVIRSGADITQYQYLLIEKAVGERLPSPANSLNHSKLKKRMTMMYKTKPRTLRRVASLATIPALLAGVAIVNSSAVASVISETGNATMFDNVADKVTNFSADSEMIVAENASKSTSASVSAASSKEEEKVYTVVDKAAEYPGGMNALMTFLASNIRYPENAQKNNVQGRVVVRFVVGKDGKISDAKVMKGVDPELDAEAVKVIMNMPKWEPGEAGGKPVASYFNLPVSFKLHDMTPNDSTVNK